jgi:chemotaxis receptor (MCP) glutamine deamidase CheD|tara:strand:- start:2474 stop:4432 length:1959 start_codon:yes stop_codon:yes gene_type:complete
MSGVFLKSQKTNRIQRPKNRSELEFGLFSSISEAEVVGTGGQGTIRVVRIGNDYNDQGEVEVMMLSPHASYKPADAGGDNIDSFEDTQTASGMVVPTPQIGTRGIIATPNKDSTRGVWLGSIMPPGLGQTIPEPARSDQVTGKKADLDEYASPVGMPASEKNASTYDGRVTTDKAKRAIHPFAKVLKNQGLLVDTIRGSSTSSILRDNDSKMIGFNTPGGVGTSQDLTPTMDEGGEVTKKPMNLTRLGGHTFVMDDGDTGGENNLVRIRSGKGAQILFHDTSEMVYIGNQNGTAWIEMTKDGKIDMYAKDSVSIHSEADFNFRADRDINFEAGRHLNIKGIERTQIEADQLRLIGKQDTVIDSRGSLDLVGTNMTMSTNDLSMNTTNLNISNKINTKIRSGEIDIVSQYGMRQSHGTGLEIKTNVLENQIWNAQTYNPGRTYYKGETVIFGTLFYKALQQNMIPSTPGVKVPPSPGLFWQIIPPVIPKTVHGDIKLDTNIAGPMLGNIDIHAKGTVTATSQTGAINLQTIADNINIQTPKTVYIDGTSAVHLNLPGPVQPPALPIVLSALATSIPFPFDTSASGGANGSEFGVYENPITDPSKPWNEAYYQSDDVLYSIMKRVPMHEPWSGHEAGDGVETTASNTDRETSGE